MVSGLATLVLFTLCLFAQATFFIERSQLLSDRVLSVLFRLFLFPKARLFTPFAFCTIYDEEAMLNFNFHDAERHICTI